jgi:hypothetical protein
MKKLILIACFTIFWFSGVFAQKLDLSYSVDSVKKNSTFLYSLKIEIKNGSAPFNLYIYNKEPWDGGKPIKVEENYTLYYYSFTNLEKGQYIIIVKSKDEIITKKITL